MQMERITKPLPTSPVMLSSRTLPPTVTVSCMRLNLNRQRWRSRSSPKRLCMTGGENEWGAAQRRDELYKTKLQMKPNGLTFSTGISPVEVLCVTTSGNMLAELLQLRSNMTTDSDLDRIGCRIGSKKWLNTWEDINLGTSAE